MSLTVVLRETALRNLARLRSEDKDAFAQMHEVDDEAGTVYVINIGIIS